jgi:hypothetical protein
VSQGWTEYVILIDGQESGVERTKKMALARAANERIGHRGAGRVRIKKRRVGFVERGGGKRNPSKAERAVKSQKAASKRRVANALANYLKRLNPGKATPGAVRVKRLKGGGVTITPVKVVRSKR